MISPRSRASLAASLALILVAAPLLAQTPAARFVDSARVEIDHAVHDMDQGRLDRTMLLLDRALVAFPDDPYLLHYRGYAAYWKVAGAMMGGHMEGMAPVIKQALADLAKSADHLAWPET